jgi:hypothetical protein
MDQAVIVKNHRKPRGGLPGFVKRLFQNGKPTRRPQLGRTIGVVWEWKSVSTGTPVACIVQIERGETSARMTIYDCNDIQGTSVTNMIENIASGVYLEHLADDYTPEQIQLFHRDTLLSATEPQWGTKPVMISWNKSRQCFESPSWGKWEPDFKIDPLEKILIRELRSTAAVAVEAWMRQRQERQEITPREKELYDRYQQHISAQSENFRYNLRGGWLFAPPSTYI